MKMMLVLAGMAATIAIASPAQAKTYCCKIRPDVCIGICGSRCCGTPEKFSAGGCGADLSKIPETNLRAELRAAGRSNPEFSAEVRKELDRRDKGSADLKTSN